MGRQELNFTGYWNWANMRLRPFYQFRLHRLVSAVDNELILFIYLQLVAKGCKEKTNSPAKGATMISS